MGSREVFVFFFKVENIITYLKVCGNNAIETMKTDAGEMGPKSRREVLEEVMGAGIPCLAGGLFVGAGWEGRG